MAQNRSEHILSTSGNLLGFCLIIITSIHITNVATTSLIDDVASIVSFLLAASCFLSFAAMRTIHESFGKKCENIADFLFLASLLGILVLSTAISFSFIK